MRPRKVKIGSHDIKIHWVKRLSDASDRRGTACWEDKEVHLDPKKIPAETLIHELSHMVCWFLGIEDEEKVTVQSENTIAMLIRDNPSVMRWIVDEIAGPLPTKKKKKRK